MSATSPLDRPGPRRFCRCCASRRPCLRAGPMCLGTAFAADLYWTKHPRESGSSRFVNTSLIAASACRFPLLPSSRRPHPHTDSVNTGRKPHLLLQLLHVLGKRRRRLQIVIEALDDVHGHWQLSLSSLGYRRQSFPQTCVGVSQGFRAYGAGEAVRQRYT